MLYLKGYYDVMFHVLALPASKTIAKVFASAGQTAALQVQEEQLLCWLALRIKSTFPFLFFDV